MIAASARHPKPIPTRVIRELISALPSCTRAPVWTRSSHWPRCSIAERPQGRSARSVRRALRPQWIVFQLGDHEAVIHAGEPDVPGLRAVPDERIHVVDVLVGIQVYPGQLRVRLGAWD